MWNFRQVIDSLRYRRKLSLLIVAVLICVGLLIAGKLYAHINKALRFRSAISQASENVRTAEANEDKFQAFLNLGKLHAEAGNHKKAIESFQSAEKVAGGSDPNVFMAIAENAQKVGEDELARQYYQKAIDLYRLVLPPQAADIVVKSIDLEMIKLKKD